MTHNTCVIIGAGIGGITTALFLARHGFQVTVIEKNPFPGGRCGLLELGDFRFDTGATLLLMRKEVEHIFHLAGVELEQELDLIRIDPTCQLYFDDGYRLELSGNLHHMKSQLDRQHPSDFQGFLKLLEQGNRFYHKALHAIIKTPMHRFFNYITPTNLKTILQIQALKKHYTYVSQYVSDPHLRAALTYQNLYIGIHPFVAPAMYAMFPAMEAIHGLYYPRGGMHQLIKVLVKAAEAQGVQFVYGKPVKQIIQENQRVVGIRCEGETEYIADKVVSNADLPYTYSTLLANDPTAPRLQKMKYACSAITFYWALNKRVDPIEHQHNVFLNSDYKGGLDPIFYTHTFASPPQCYLHAPSRN